MDVQKSVLDLFNVMVIDSEDDRLTTPNIDNLADGFITDFNPTITQTRIMQAAFKPLDVTTLFTVEERENRNPLELIAVQLFHYIEVYGLGLDGSMTVPLPGDKAVSLKVVRGVTRDELGGMIRKLIYSNAPIKDTQAVKDILDAHDIQYDLSRIENNELRVLVFDLKRDVFQDGDDAVRWMCWKATDSPMLIKSQEVIDAVHDAKYDFSDFLRRHLEPLAQVFNRHKKIILAAKRSAAEGNMTNRISRRSKKAHVPLHQPIAKQWVTLALGQDGKDSVVESSLIESLGRVTLRDKMKFLNLLSYKRMQQDADAFMIRNGKLHVEGERRIYPLERIDMVEQAVLDSLRGDLSGLQSKSIKLDPAVDYGLPLSRKQTLGNLPYGTKVTVYDGTRISAGMYWENRDGAHDLDLSTIDQNGKRVGWGQVSGYNDEQVVFSGDITNAPKGAMEFMTSSDAQYGLFVNIYSGDIGAKMKLVVGAHSGKKWIDEPIIREEYALDSKGCTLGFVNGLSFTVYCGRISGSVASFGVDKPKALAARGLFDFWTVGRLLKAIDVPLIGAAPRGGVDPKGKQEYDHDLTYERFSYDRLENLFFG